MKKVQAKQKSVLGEPSGRGDFQTTCWTQVVDAARHGRNADAMAARSMEMLCQRYWFPLYAFLRRRGHDPATAEDYVQGFFAHLLSKNTLEAATPQRGRFRTFLLTACKNYAANQLRHQRAQRRGGHLKALSFDADQGETRYAAEAIDTRSPEKLFDRQWALETIEGALEQLAARYAEGGKSKRFEALRPLLAPAGNPPTHAEIGRALGMTEGAVKVAAHRLRQQFAAALRDQVAATVDLHQPSETESKPIDRELAELLSALSSD